MSDNRIELLKSHIRDVPDFPKPGIVFKDITPLLSAPEAFRTAVDLLVEHYRPMKLDTVVAVESRGFIFGSVLAHSLGLPLSIVRKPGKLPWKTHSVEYTLEYGTDKLEIHQDALEKGHRVAVIDDLLATGGTAAATAQLCSRLGAEVLDCGFVIELSFLGGREKISPTRCFSLISY
jgi:adenine phosphoribosyltransferase